MKPPFFLALEDAGHAPLLASNADAAMCERCYQLWVGPQDAEGKIPECRGIPLKADGSVYINLPSQEWRRRYENLKLVVRDLL